MDSNYIMKKLSNPESYNGLDQFMTDARKEIPEVSAALRNGQKPPIEFPVTEPAANEEDDAPKRGRPLKIRLRVPVLAEALEKLGIVVRWNLVTHRFDFSGIPDEWDLNPESREDGFRVMLEDTLCEDYSGLNRLPDLISVIGDQCRYNPVLEYIEAAPYISESERDYTREIINILGIDDDDLSVSLFCNWLLQGIALLHNDEKRHYSPDGILVLQGGQGIGKTSVARGLGMKPEWTLEGARLDAFDKDTLIRLTSRFVSELGELDATFKRADAARMKAFITNESDTYRRPYGRNDVTMWRRTSLIGTINEPQFLIDQTGNRRYWTVPIERIDLPALRGFNFRGLWRQTLEAWRDEDANGRGGDCYRLTLWQRSELDKRNDRFRVSLKAQDEIADIFAEAEASPDLYEWRYAKLTDFQQANPSLARYSGKALGAALNAMGCKQGQGQSDGKHARTRLLPFPKQS